ncbi:MAG: hypothetical protein ACO1TE_05465 [Prosthecobacter sp.]
MIKNFRWFFPATTAVAGLLLGGWGSGGFAPKKENNTTLAKAPAAAKAGPQPEAAATVVHAQPTAEEAAREQEARQLWQTAGLEPTLEALTAYARLNPARALDLAMSLKGENAWQLVMKLVQTLPVHAGGVAMDVLLRHPQYCKPCPPMDAVFGLCAKSDPERAWREAHAAGVPFTSAALDAIARGCGETNPRKAMELAARLTEVKEQTKFMRTVLSGWADEDPRDLVAWLGTQADAAAFFPQVPWGRLQFETQADFLAMVGVVPLEVFDGSLEFSQIFGTAGEGGWATRLDWLQAVPDKAQRHALYAGAARALMHADPEKALALMPEIENARLRQQITSATAAYRAAISPEAGFAFADSLTDEKARRLARQSVLNTWAENDPAAAARYALASQLPPDEGYMGMRYQLGHKWAELDPQAAVSHALTHEPQDEAGSPGGTVLGSAMSQWVYSDPYTASGWVNALPSGTRRDTAAAALARASMRMEPDGAMVWAANIADPGLRQRTVQSCFETWLRMDQSQAARWLEQAALDESTHQALAAAAQSASAHQDPGTRWNSSNGIIVVY